MPPSIDVLISSSASDWPTVLMALKRPLPAPNVMVPKQSFETRRPVLPSVAYSMAFSFSTITLTCKLLRNLLNRTQCKFIGYYAQCDMLQESTACLFQGAVLRLWTRFSRASTLMSEAKIYIAPSASLRSVDLKTDVWACKILPQRMRGSASAKRGTRCKASRKQA